MSGRSPDELQAQVEEQREQLAGTIDALSSKLDVKAQAQAKVDDAKTRAQQLTMTPEGKPRPELLAAVAALVAVTVAALWWRHR